YDEQNQYRNDQVAQGFILLAQIRCLGYLGWLGRRLVFDLVHKWIISLLAYLWCWRQRSWVSHQHLPESDQWPNSFCCIPGLPRREIGPAADCLQRRRPRSAVAL